MCENKSCATDEGVLQTLRKEEMNRARWDKLNGGVYSEGSTFPLPARGEGAKFLMDTPERRASSPASLEPFVLLLVGHHRRVNASTFSDVKHSHGDAAVTEG